MRHLQLLLRYQMWRHQHPILNGRGIIISIHSITINCGIVSSYPILTNVLHTPPSLLPPLPPPTVSSPPSPPTRTVQYLHLRQHHSLFYTTTGAESSSDSDAVTHTPAPITLSVPECSINTKRTNCPTCSIDTDCLQRSKRGLCVISTFHPKHFHPHWFHRQISIHSLSTDSVSPICTIIVENSAPSPVVLGLLHHLSQRQLLHRPSNPTEPPSNATSNLISNSSSDVTVDVKHNVATDASPPTTSKSNFILLQI